MISQTLLFYIHLVIIAFVVTIPLLPARLLPYAIFTPWVVVFLWIVFDGCVIVRYYDDASLSHEDFIRKITTTLFPSSTISDARIRHIVTFGLLTLVYLCHLRIVAR